MYFVVDIYGRKSPNKSASTFDMVSWEIVVECLRVAHHGGVVRLAVYFVVSD